MSRSSCSDNESEILPIANEAAKDAIRTLLKADWDIQMEISKKCSCMSGSDRKSYVT